MRFASVAVLALCLFACSNDKQYLEALKTYDALITAKTPLQHPAYDEVLGKLDVVAESDNARALEARRLAAAIRALRAPTRLPPRPLAVVTAEPQEGGDDVAADDVARKSRECGELAKAIGRVRGVDGGQDAAMAELVRCRRELEKLNIARVHAQDPLGEAGHGHEGPVVDGGSAHPGHDGG